MISLRQNIALSARCSIMRAGVVTATAASTLTLSVKVPLTPVEVPFL